MVRGVRRLRRDAPAHPGPARRDGAGALRHHDAGAPRRDRLVRAAVGTPRLLHPGARDGGDRPRPRHGSGAARRAQAQGGGRGRAHGREAGRRGVQELRRADAGAAHVRAGLPGRAVAARQAQAGRSEQGRALGAVHPEAGDCERLQRAQRSRGAAPPLRAAGASPGRRRSGGAAARRGLPPGARVRHAPERRRRDGGRPAAHDPRGSDEHPRRDSVPDAAARVMPALPLQHILLVAAALAITLYLWHYRPSSLEAWIALRYLRSRRSSRLLSLITVIAVGGVTVGVMALVVVLGVMNGLQTDLRDKILVANPHLRVLTYGEGLRLDDWHRVLERVRQTPGVEAAAPFVLTQAGVSAGHDYAEGVVVLGVEPDTGRRAVTSFAQHFTKGDLRFRTTRPDVEGGIALGARLASKLSTNPGDVVHLVSFTGTKFNPSVGAYVPQFHRYEVTGIFDTGMYEYDNSYVALDRRVAQRFAGLDSAVTGVEVRLADPWKAREFAARLEADLLYPYRALDWQTQNQSLFSALKLEKLAMAFVVFLICVVAAFNVVGTLTMVVRDKTREIGILLAMGLKQGSIRRVFLAQGILVGLTGTSLGVALGLVVGGMVNRGHWIPIDPSIYFIDHLPVHMQPLDALSVIAASLLVAMLAPLPPSVQASRLDPVTAIRYE